MTHQGVLQGDVAIVTGAGRNIGRATAERFADEGARGVVVDTDEGRANETVDRITSAGGEAVASITNITDEKQIVAMVETTEEAFGPVDILVNNIAISDRDGLMDLTVEEFDQVLAVNLRGAFLCTREAARSMRESGGGRIVNVASTSAHKGRASAPAYATSKSGILNFTRSPSPISASTRSRRPVRGRASVKTILELARPPPTSS